MGGLIGRGDKEMAILGLNNEFYRSGGKRWV